MDDAPPDVPRPPCASLPPPPCPPSDGDAPARPAFLLAGGLSSLASFQRVKSRDELVDFTAHSPKTSPESCAMSPTQRIREFDTYRLHTAGLPERGAVGIPSSVDRINITNLNHLLILCGGYAGVRFSTEELAALKTLSRELEEQFNKVEKSYKDMTGAQKKLKLGPPGVASDGADAAPAVDAGVLAFHSLADEYICTIRRLQELARTKRSQIVPRGADDLALPLGEAVDVTPGADVDLLAGLARPVWLDVLMVKYSRHMNKRSGTSTGTSTAQGGSAYPHCDPLNLGSFCAFLSCCLVGRIAVVVEEHRALIELMTASNDSVLRINPLVESMDEITQKILEQTQEYWAKRIFAFLKKLPDLKTAVKDNRLLLDFDRHAL